MTTPADELEAAERLRQLLVRCDTEGLIDLLMARNEQRVARLRTACQTLRAALEDQAAAHRRLIALAAARQINGAQQ